MWISNLLFQHLINLLNNWNLLVKTSFKQVCVCVHFHIKLMCICICPNQSRLVIGKSRGEIGANVRSNCTGSRSSQQKNPTSRVEGAGMVLLVISVSTYTRVGMYAYASIFLSSFFLSSYWSTRDHIGRSTRNSNPVMTSSAGGTKGCSDHKFRAPQPTLPNC